MTSGGLFRINTNISAQFAQRQLGSANRTLDEANQRLSSGKRINSAADDAAGLAISKKMTTQIQGLEMGARNAQDGISLVQTAEGSLEESQSSLQRMRELAIQSANDTLTQSDRDKVQKEVNNLAIELQRIADDTEFNERNLLDGTLEDAQFQVGANERQRIRVDIRDMGTQDGALDIADYGETDRSIQQSTITVSTATVGASTDIGTNDDGTYRITRDNGTLQIRGSSGTKVAEAVTSSKNAGVIFEGTTNDGGPDFGDDQIRFSVAVTEGEFEINGGNVVTSTLPDQQLQDAEAKNSLTAGEYTVESSPGGGFQLVDDEGNVDAVNNSTGAGGPAQFVDPGSSSDVVLDFSDSVQSSLASTAGQIFSGGEKITVGGPNISETISDADQAITQVDRALEKLSEQRADLGAKQNRLETTMSVNSISSENLSAARSRIRDTDIAAESVKRTRANILLQASSSVLSQSNQNPQLALQLLG